MKTDCHLDYETVLCGRAEVVHLALVFKAEKQASARQSDMVKRMLLEAGEKDADFFTLLKRDYF